MSTAYRLLKHISPSLRGRGRGGAIMLLLLVSSCSYIDDHASDCPCCDNGTAVNVDYNIRVVSNISVQINDQLKAETDAEVRDYLSGRYVNPTINSKASLFFYPKSGGAPTSIDAQMDHNTISVSLRLSAQQYRHITAIGMSKTVQLKDSDADSTLCLQQIPGDTLGGHEQPLYTGRLDMTIENNVSQNFEVNLYRADADVAVLVTKKGTFKDVKVYLTDLANGFNINDSTYTFTSNPLIRTEAQAVPKSDVTAYTATVFPSRDSAPGTIDPDVPAAKGAVWRVIVMATLPDNTVTRSVLYVRKPLRAGDLRIFRLLISTDGAAEVSAADVGASVTLDWKKGGEYNPEI